MAKEEIEKLTVAVGGIVLMDYNEKIGEVSK